MTNPPLDPYAWRCAQPDEPSVQTPDGRTIDPLNLGAVLPRRPVNPLARLIVSARPMTKLRLPDGTVTDLEVEETPLPRGYLQLLSRRAKRWALKQLHALGVAVPTHTPEKNP